MRMGHKQFRSARRIRGGFTLVELLVACTITSVVLLGAYELFRQVTQVESRTAVAWNDLERAEAAAGYLAGLFMTCVNYGEDAAIRARDFGGRKQWTLQTSDACVRLDWQPSSQSRRGVLSVQEIPCAGQTPLGLHLDEGATRESLADRSAWLSVDRRIVGDRLDGVTVRFRLMEEASTAWRETWMGRSGAVAVWITVAVGEQTARRMLTPPADADYDIQAEN